MRSVVLALHGFGMNGGGMRHLLRPLLRPSQEPEQGPNTFEGPYLDDLVEPHFPDAPGVAPEASMADLTRLLGGLRPRAPNLQWWNASADGRLYAGWEESQRALQETATRLVGSQSPLPRLGLIGFSQGAAVAATLAALAARAQFPPLRFVVLIGGFSPRAEELSALFGTPLGVPSLHVVGAQDPLARHASALLERFSAATREELHWAGGHTIPAGADARRVLEFIERNVGNG